METNKTQTIARSSSKQIKALAARITGIRLYTLDNGFSGEALGLDRVQSVLSAWNATRGAQLTVKGNVATVSYHSNRWLKLDLAAAS